MLKIENISTGYGKKQVIFGVSFEVKKGEIVLLAGTNGSGKSTLLKVIYGLLPQWDSGKILLNGENITGRPASTLLKKGLLYTSQKNNLFEDLSVKENLEMAGITLDQKKLRQRIENTLSIFPKLVPYLNRTPMKLSGGERRLLVLAMATLHQPKMMLIDEPFTGLSSQNINLVIESLEALNNKDGITFLIVEHRVKEAIKIADKIIGLKFGKVFNELWIDQDFDIKALNPVFI